MGGEGGCKKETQIPGIPNALLLQTVTLQFRFKGGKRVDIANYTWKTCKSWKEKKNKRVTLICCRQLSKLQDFNAAFWAEVCNKENRVC